MLAILSQLESRGASGDPVVAAPRLRASRRQQDWPGKHDCGVRSRTGGRRRWPRARRPPLARRHCRRPSRRAARSHHAGERARSPIAPPPSLRELDVPTLRDVLARYPDDRHHHRVEGSRARARRARSSTRCAAPAPRDRVCLGSFSRVGAARRARGRAGDRDERRAVRSADGVVSIVVRPVARPRAVSGVSGSRNQRLARASSRRASCSSRTRPASPCRCGRSTSRTISDVCSTGEWTALSQTGRMSPREVVRDWVSRQSQSTVVSRQSTVAVGSQSWRHVSHACDCRLTDCRLDST